MPMDGNLLFTEAITYGLFSTGGIDTVILGLIILVGLAIGLIKTRMPWGASLALFDLILYFLSLAFGMPFTGLFIGAIALTGGLMFYAAWKRANT